MGHLVSKILGVHGPHPEPHTVQGICVFQNRIQQPHPFFVPDIGCFEVCKSLAVIQAMIFDEESSCRIAVGGCVIINVPGLCSVAVIDIIIRPPNIMIKNRIT